MFDLLFFFHAMLFLLACCWAKGLMMWLDIGVYLSRMDAMLEFDMGFDLSCMGLLVHLYIMIISMLE